MAQMEELSEQCGKFCWRWNDLVVKQGKKIRALALVLDPGEGSSGSVFLNALQEDTSSAVRVF